MEEILDNIIAYLDYLNAELGLSTSVHFTPKIVSQIPVAIFQRLLPYNVHINPYCALVKKDRMDTCVAAQREVQSLACQGGFCRTCHAGVLDYLNQFRSGDEVMGYVSVSGYRCSCERVLAQDRECWESNLSPEPLPVERCQRLIPPLCRMFELLFTFPMDGENWDEYKRILQHINERHGCVTLEDLGASFGRSRSYISHLFNSRSHIAFRAYCNEQKLHYAKMLLANPRISVTDVALDAGYNDVSYFILLFRERFGVTPLQYRKNKPL